MDELSEEYILLEYARLRQLATEASQNAYNLMKELLRRCKEKQ